MNNLVLNTLIIGQKFINLPKCLSTNLEARTIIEKGFPIEGTVVYTNQQMAGRGQMGNTWEAQSGKNLTFSVILKPSFLKIEQQFYLSMSVAIAIHRFLSQHCLKKDVSIKWPNDILVNEKKISGALIENTLQQQTLQYSIVGIGININQTEFAYPLATSLQNITGQSYELESVLKEFLIILDKEYQQLRQSTFDVIKNDYLALLFRFGEWHTYQINHQQLQGKIIDLDSSGRLIVEHRQGTMKAYSLKEVGYVFESKEL